MPAPAKPREKEPLSPNRVELAGKQEHFRETGEKLASDLGWYGEPHFVTVGVTVGDARNWLTKTLHEAFQAGAKGEDKPSYIAACEHLNIDDENERSMVRDAVDAEYEAGKGATVETVDKILAPIGADLQLPLTGEGS
jgi:hypothetical protein